MYGRTTTWVLLALGWFAASSSASAEASLLEMMRAHPECRQFNDGCSICRIENGAAACSTPGIACIQTAWTCTDTGAATPGQEGVPLVRSASIALTGAIGRQLARLPEP